MKALDETALGIADQNATIVRLFVNGMAQRTAAVNADGTYTINSKFYFDSEGNRHRLSAGDIVKIDYGSTYSQVFSPDIAAEVTVVE